MQKTSPFRSRKYILTIVQLSITILLPVCYKLLDIPNDITMVCLTASAGLTAAYLGANSFSKKKDDAS